MPKSDSLPLIQAKLHRPAVGRLFIHRPRLNEQLDRGLDGPLTLVCAPAGFGKTTAVSAWIENLQAETADGSPFPAAWLTLDERDGDLNVFMRYFIAALRTIFPGACENTQELLRASTSPDSDLLAVTLSNEIAALPTRFVMALDDNAFGEKGVVYDLFGKLLRQWPPLLHLVMIGRREPPLPLARPRANGLLTELRAADLRFTKEEITELVELYVTGHPDAAYIDRLERTTEGWIAGLHLMVRQPRASDAAGVEDVLAISNIARVTDDLFGEILTAQPEPVHVFLLQTAILERFNASLAAAVIGHEQPDCDARECIAWIEGADLFVSAQDDRGVWYRCHPLFQEFLLKRMRTEYSTEHVSRLHERAANWFAERGETDEAMHHALAAANLDLAARVVEQSVCDVLNGDDQPALERRLRLLPDALIARRPGLLMVRAWRLQFSWQLAAQARVLDQVEALLAADEGRDPGELDYDAGVVRGQVTLMRAQQAYWENRHEQAIALCQEGLALLPESWHFARGAAMLYEGVAMWARGDGDAVPRRLMERYAALENKTDYVAHRHLMALCFIWHESAQLERLRQTAQVMLEQAQRGDSANMRNWALYFLGVAYYERYDLEEARQPIRVLSEHHYTIWMASKHDSFALMALVLQKEGDIAGAMQLVHRLSKLDLEHLGDESDMTRALRAMLQLLAGQVEEAGRWADTFMGPVPNRPLLWIANPHLARARILVARNRDTDAATALAIIEELSHLAEHTASTRTMIECLALRALALDAMGRSDEALGALRQSLDLCHPGDFVRVFVDLGPHMMAMLRHLARQDFAPETIRRILTAFPGAAYGPPSSGSGNHARRVSAHVDPSLVEPLTQREFEILGLLRMALSDKEIARELFLSPLTVKRYTANIYGKLGVHRRADAVARAEVLGILPPR